MSLINKMLQDLDRRHIRKAIDKGLPSMGMPRMPAPGSAARRSLPKGPFIVAAAAALILLIGLG
ncbi:MAG: hypothetical protein K8F27_03135, partial [Sulfuricellaceae bacterium]|nr:hypothetical protein [Sulfuricellaceae bacterium]